MAHCNGFLANSQPFAALVFVVLPLISNVRATSFSLADLVAIALLVAAVAMVTRLVTRTQARNSLLESLFEQAPPIALMDPGHRVVRINPEFARVFGYTREEAMGRRLADLIVPTEQWQDFQRQAERVDGGERVEVEALCRRKDGSPIHILSVTLPVSASGNRSVVFGLYRDITQRKTAEIALQGMSARLIEVQEAERKHLARELHDEIGQLLTGLRLMLRTAGHTRTGSLPDRLEEARGIVDDLLSRVRALSFDLRPADLDLLGLLPALLSLFERYTQQTGIQVNFKHEGIERRFPPAVETGAYRIVQEALTNAARHAGVAGVTVHAFATRRSLKLQIADRGCGFDRDLALKSSRSSGLAGMKERISLLNGSLIVESSPGHGATITAEAPLPTQNEDVPKP